MKIWVVYLWEPYESQRGHQYFIHEENARKRYGSLYKKDEYPDKYWEIEEIETEDE